MPDQYYQSTLTGQQLDEAFSKLGQVDESAAAAAASAQAAAQSARDARPAGGDRSRQRKVFAGGRRRVGRRGGAQRGGGELLR